MILKAGGQNRKTTRKDLFKVLECWQINLHRCKAASYNLDEVTKKVSSGLIIVQETWTYRSKIRGKPRGWNLFEGAFKDKRPRACIYATPDLHCSLIPRFSDEDVVAVRIKNVYREGYSFVFVSHTWLLKNLLIIEGTVSLH